MYHIAIVDDEQIVKLAVKSMIDWNSGEYELAGTASDGLAALQLVDRTSVDIMITDLKMPRMDGLELIAALKDRPSPPAVLVLSNHGDFGLVREALRQGAKDYLLKTDISPEILGQSLSELTATLGRPKGMDPPNGNCDAVSLVLVDDGLPGLEARFAEVRSDEADCRFTVLVAKSSGPVDDLAGLVGTLAEQGLKACRRCFLARGPEGEGILVALVHPGIEVAPQTMAAWLVDQGRMYYDCEFGIVHAPLIADRSRLKSTLLEVLRVSGQFFYAKCQGKVLSVGDYRDQSDRELLLRSRPKVGTNLADSVRILVEWCAEHRVSPKFLKREISAALPTPALAEAVLAAPSDRDLLGLFTTPDGPRYRSEVQAIIEYLAAHPNEKVSVARLAQLVRMSESYLCTIFKDQTGKSIINFINDDKLDRARELLSTGKYLIKEVAIAVGIEDPFYFNRLFKRRFGKAPSEFIPG
jgi:AraC-like DNA-binding protein/CheY-like chemotaxis protein